MSKSKKKLPNLNNPFVLIQVIILSLIRLVAILFGGLLAIVTLAVHKWMTTLIILALVFITLFTFGVIAL